MVEDRQRKGVVYNIIHTRQILYLENLNSIGYYKIWLVKQLWLWFNGTIKEIVLIVSFITNLS